jgi:hypothetical protein
MGEATVRVIHRHRIGHQPPFARVSELVYTHDIPVAVLTWLNYDGVRTPCVCVELDPAKLRGGGGRRLFVYEGTTVDPRYADE